LLAAEKQAVAGPLRADVESDSPEHGDERHFLINSKPAFSHAIIPPSRFHRLV
jgi:hypothetical protein